MFFLKGFIEFLTIIFRRPKFAVMTAIMVFAIVTVISIFWQKAITDIPVYVVDHDNSTVSRSIRLFFDSASELKVLGTLDSLEEAKDILYQGDVAAVIYIPEGTSEAIKTQNGAHVISYIDGTNMLLAKNADKAIQTVVKMASVGVSMIAMQRQGLPKHALMGALQPINLDVERPFNVYTAYSVYLLPVLIFFCLNIFTCIMTSACFQEPLKPAIKSHHYRRRFYYFGRLTAVFVLAMIMGLLIYMVALPIIDIHLAGTPFMALSSLVAYIILSMLLFTSINLMMPIAVSMSVAYLTCMLSVMFSGLTWPLEMMPWWMQIFVVWIPLTPFLQSVQMFLYQNVSWADLHQFHEMFVKQAILYICVTFALVRVHDVIIFTQCKFEKRKLRKNAGLVPALAGNGGPVPDVNSRLTVVQSDNFSQNDKNNIDVPSDNIDSSSVQNEIPPENANNSDALTEQNHKNLKNMTEADSSTTSEIPAPSMRELLKAIEDSANQNTSKPVIHLPDGAQNNEKHVEDIQ